MNIHIILCIIINVIYGTHLVPPDYDLSYGRIMDGMYLYKVERTNVNKETKKPKWCIGLLYIPKSIVEKIITATIYYQIYNIITWPIHLKRLRVYIH